MQIRCGVFLTMQTLAGNRLCVLGFGSLFEYVNVVEGRDGQKEADITLLIRSGLLRLADGGDRSSSTFHSFNPKSLNRVPKSFMSV